MSPLIHQARALGTGMLVQAETISKRWLMKLVTLLLGKKTEGLFHCVPFQNIASLYLFIFGWGGSSLLWGLFSGCGGWGLLCGCGVWASHCRGSSGWGAGAAGHASFSSRGSGAQQSWLLGSGAQAPDLRHTSLLAPRHVGSAQFRSQTHVSWIRRWILYHCTTCKVPILFLLVQFGEKNYHAACIIDSINTWILKTTQKDEWRQKVPMTVLD